MSLSIPVRIVLWQFAVGLAASVVWLLAAGPASGLAALAGGSIAALLSLYFAAKVPVGRPEVTPRQFVAAFYRAEALKLLMAVVAFTVAVLLFENAFLPLISTYAASTVVYFAALLWTE